MAKRSPLLLMAKREVQLLRRTRTARGMAVLLAAVAWLPALLPPLRRGSVALASFEEMVPLQLAIAGVVLPLLALLAGAELLAGELEDGSLVPILTLPISRRTCFLGKSLGRGALLALAYLVAAASAGGATVIAVGAEGWRDWAAVAGAGLLLSFATGGVGAALGAAGRGRVRAFGAALIAWLVLVLALDAALLTAVVALAPAPPAQIGMHGHAELSAPGAEPPGDDPHARHAQPEAAQPVVLSASLMALNPVSLFRLTALSLSPRLRPQLGLVIPGLSVDSLWITMTVGWSVWLVLPLVAARHRLQHANLN